MKTTLPILIIVIFIISIIISYLYSKYITSPIIRICRLSKKLAALDFRVNFSNERKDEIGILSDNLDNLSNQLSAALEDFKNCKYQLEEDVKKEKQLEKKQLIFFLVVSHGDEHHDYFGLLNSRNVI